MSDYTYTAVVIYPPTAAAAFPPDGVISATIANPTSTAAFSTIVFESHDAITPAGSATVTATFPPPAWSLSVTLTLPVTFMLNQGTLTTSYVAYGANLASVAAPPTIVTISSSTTSSITTTTSGASTHSSSSSQTATNTATPHTHQPGKQYSTGELAGAAVGCLVAGLLIAGFLAFFLFRRRSKGRNHRMGTRKPSSQHEVHGESLLVDADGGGMKGWEKQLPQPDSDKTLGQLASRTLDEVEMFVEEFYVDKQTSFLGTNDASELSAFNSPHLPGPLTDLLRTASSPTVLIKHCIAVFLLQKIDPSNRSTESLLPREYIIPRTSQMSHKDSRQELSQIRVLMAHMLPDPGQDSQYTVYRDQTVKNAAQQVELAFRPWARGDASKRTSALEGIAIHVSELGIKLFAQPSSFRWQWNQPSPRAGSKVANETPDEVAMLPGLDKITGQRGELLSPCICLVKPRWGNWGW